MPDGTLVPMSPDGKSLKDNYSYSTEELAAVADGSITPGDLVSATMPLAEIQEGFDMLARREAIKVVITMR